MLHDSLYISSVKIDLNASISENGFMNMGMLFSPNKLLRQVLIILALSTIKPKRQAITKNICNNFFLTIKDNALLKSIL